MQDRSLNFKARSYLAGNHFIDLTDINLVLASCQFVIIFVVRHLAVLNSVSEIVNFQI